MALAGSLGWLRREARPGRSQAAVIALLATVALLVPPLGDTRAHAVFPGVNGRIAITVYSVTQGFSDVYTARADGSDLRQLTRTGSSGSPRWSPSGRHVAFLRTNSQTNSADVLVVRADGTGMRRITGGVVPGEPPAWSPYGDELLVVRPVGGGTDLFRVPLTGGTGTRVTYSAGQDCRVHHPSWRGSLVVYDRDCPGRQQLRLLDFSTGANRLVIGTTSGSISVPDFTADLRILFMGCGLSGDQCLQSENVARINRNGSGLIYLEYFSGMESEPSATDPAPSPDGHAYALVVDPPGFGDEQAGRSGVYARAGGESFGVCCADRDLAASQPDWQRRPN